MPQQSSVRICGVPVLFTYEQIVRIVLVSVVSLLGMTQCASWVLGRPFSPRLLGWAVMTGLISGPMVVLVHELAHALTARMFGVVTGIFIRNSEMRTRMMFPEQAGELSPIAHIAIALMGPVTHLPLMILMAGAALLLPSLDVLFWSAFILILLTGIRSLLKSDGRICWHFIKKISV